jgi:hypothetical protein
MHRIENKIIGGFFLILLVFYISVQEEVISGTVTAFNSLSIENAEVHSKKNEICRNLLILWENLQLSALTKINY